MAFKIDLPANTLPKYTHHLESIHTQHDDPVVDEIVNQYENIITDIQNRPELYNTFKIFGDKNIQQYYSNIEEICFKRFGVRILHAGSSEQGLYGVMPCPPPVYTGASNDAKMLADNLTEFKDYAFGIPTKVTGPNVEKLGDIYQSLYKSYEKIDIQLKKSGIRVDFHKARLDRVPEGYAIYALIDIYTLVMKARLTARELTALFFHEIGHIFSHIATSYQNITQSRAIIEDIKLNLLDKNLAPKDAIVLQYKKLTRVNTEEDLSKLSTQVVAVKFLSAVAQEFVMTSYNRYDSLEDEMHSDRFATRFGLGQDLATGLAKMTFDNTDFFNIFKDILYYNFFGNIFMLLWHIILFVVAAMQGALVWALVVSIAVWVFGGILLYLKKSFYRNATNVIPDEYEGDYKRMGSIRREINRIVKESLSQGGRLETIEAFLDQIDAIERIMEAIHRQDKNKNAFLKLTAFMNPYMKYKNTAQVNYAIGNIVKDLESNDLYNATARLDIASKKIKGK